MGGTHGVEDGWSGTSWLRRRSSGGWMLGVSSDVVQSLARIWQGHDEGREC